MVDLQKTIELVAGSFELMRGKLDDEGWSRNLAAAMDAESALCIRWSAGMPDKVICTGSGPHDSLPPGWPNWADHVAQLAQPASAQLLDDMLATTDRAELEAANPCKDPQMLVGLIDWQPAYIWLAVHRDKHLGPWTDADRAHFLYICQLTHRSALLHKHHAQIATMSSTTVDILNNSPRAILSLAVDGRIHFSNTMGEKILAANDGIRSRNGKLTFSDPAAQAELDDFLKTMAVLKIEQITQGSPAITRTVSVKRNSQAKPYQMLYQGIRFASWSLESSAADRMIVAYLYDPASRFAPTVEQLRSYYNLTNAQAKVAVAMYTHANIVKSAESLGISVNTARTHLRAIYGKMNAGNQSELLSLLSSTIKTMEDNPQTA